MLRRKLAICKQWYMYICTCSLIHALWCIGEQLDMDGFLLCYYRLHHTRLQTGVLSFSNAELKAKGSRSKKVYIQSLLILRDQRWSAYEAWTQRSPWFTSECSCRRYFPPWVSLSMHFNQTTQQDSSAFIKATNCSVGVSGREVPWVHSARKAWSFQKLNFSRPTMPVEFMRYCQKAMKKGSPIYWRTTTYGWYVFALEHVKTDARGIFWNHDMLEWMAAPWSIHLLKYVLDFSCLLLVHV